MRITVDCTTKRWGWFHYTRCGRVALLGFHRIGLYRRTGASWSVRPFLIQPT